jgi:hypothetical protein
MVVVFLCAAHLSQAWSPAGAWAIQTVDSAGDVGHDDTAIAVDASGGVHVSYFDYAHGDLKYAYKAPGAAWVVETADAGRGEAGSVTSIAVDASGGVHVSYYDATYRAVMYAYRPSGGGWSTHEIAALSPSTSSSHNAIAVDADHGVHIVFFNASDVAYAYKPSGGSWTVSAAIAGAGSSCQGLSCALEESAPYRYLHIGYSVRMLWGTPDLKYATRRLPYGAWTVENVDWSGEVGYRNDIAVDSEGGVHLCYRRGDYSSSLRYAYRPAGGTWSNETVDAGSQTGAYTSLALDAEGGVHLSYYDGQNGVLKYAGKPKNGTWSNETVDAGGSVGMYNAIAVGPDDHVHISYYDATNHELKYATDIEPPSAPTSLTATPGDGYVALTWNAPGSDGGSPITGYTVYRGNTSGGGAALAALGNLLAYNDTTVTNGQTYFYTVTASNAAGEGAASAETMATPVEKKDDGGTAGFEFVALLGAIAAVLAYTCRRRR